mmetsp:Transcript_107880/g.170376  ORF Transcript_107880/g.170376 Transcript_107880/m.170376 type:complete len:256 (+) Transcript_107880:46-813(+)
MDRLAKMLSFFFVPMICLVEAKHPLRSLSDILLAMSQPVMQRRSRSASVRHAALPALSDSSSSSTDEDRAAREEKLRQGLIRGTTEEIWARLDMDNRNVDEESDDESNVPKTNDAVADMPRSLPASPMDDILTKRLDGSWKNDRKIEGSYLDGKVEGSTLDCLAAGDDLTNDDRLTSIFNIKNDAVNSKKMLREEILALAEARRRHNDADFDKIFKDLRVDGLDLEYYRPKEGAPVKEVDLSHIWELPDTGSWNI